MTVDGENLLSHGGTALLTELADRSGLTKAMSPSMAECGISWHTHDPGVVLTHSAVATAASGLRAIPPAVAAARAKVWAASPPGVGCETTNEPLPAMLRPGNAESNDADHHLELLDQVIEGLPAAGADPGRCVGGRADRPGRSLCLAGGHTIDHAA